jgi:hypothetical protein
MADRWAVAAPTDCASRWNVLGACEAAITYRPLIGNYRLVGCCVGVGVHWLRLLFGLLLCLWWLIIQSQSLANQALHGRFIVWAAHAYCVVGVVWLCEEEPTTTTTIKTRFMFGTRRTSESNQNAYNTTTQALNTIGKVDLAIIKLQCTVCLRCVACITDRRLLLIIITIITITVGYQGRW